MKTTRINRHLAMFIATIMALTLWAGFPLTASAVEAPLVFGGLTYTYAEGTDGSTATYASNVLTLKDGAVGTLSGTTTSANVVTEENAEVTLTLNGVTMSNKGAPISLGTNSKLTLILVDGTQNTLTGTDENPGIRTTGATLIIGGTGTLTVQGGGATAGIGGGKYGIGGNVTINNGTVNATGGGAGAGIGGGQQGAGGNITINGGTINANGGTSGAGIGGGIFADAGNITINGGNVTATGGTQGPNRGGGAGIGGGGDGGSGGNITISGGTINATGNNGGAGVGGGYLSASGNIKITGGIIIANGNGIGRGFNNNSVGTIEISGAPIIKANIAISAGSGTVTISNATAIINVPTIYAVATVDHSVLLADGTVQEKLPTGSTANKSSDPDNGILIGAGLFTLDTDADPVTVTLNANLTIPDGSMFTVPLGAKLVIPDGVTLSIANGGAIDVFGTLDVQTNGNLDVQEGGDFFREPGATITGDGDYPSEYSGAPVVIETTTVTHNTITIKKPVLASATEQDIEYAFSDTNTLPQDNDYTEVTSETPDTITFNPSTPNRTYYVFARSIAHSPYKTGTPKVLPVYVPYLIDVIFDTQGADQESITPQNGKLAGETVDTVNTVLTKTDHTFLGWYSAPNGEGTKYMLGEGGTKLSESTGVKFTDEIKTTGTITLYAFWLEGTLYEYGTLQCIGTPDAVEYTYDTIRVKDGADITVFGTTTNGRIEVQAGAKATISLNNVNITATSGSYIALLKLLNGADATIKLSGYNSFKTTAANTAGLNAPTGTTLTITSASGDKSTNGILDANSGSNSAGIGGMQNETAGNITIDGGTIIAKGGSYGAGIGGGRYGTGGNITINGGNVTATGGHQGAGIGGGQSAQGGNVIITGGNVNATGGVGATGASSNLAGAGIGASGYGGSGGSIAISGGSVISTGGDGGLGMGSSTANIDITGGTVFVKGNITTTNTLNIEDSVFLADGTVNGKATNATNAILIGTDAIEIDAASTPKTVTLKSDETVPAGKTFTIPAGVRVIVSSGKTLEIANGGALEVFGELIIEDGAELKIADNADATIGESGIISNEGGTVTGKYGGAVSDIKTTSITANSITIGTPTLLSHTEQTVEYAISETSALPSAWTPTTVAETILFEGLAPNSTHYIFARSVAGGDYKAGAPKVLKVTTTYPVTVTFETEGADQTNVSLQNDKFSGDTVDTVSALTKQDYTFAGWYSAPNGNGTRYTLGARGTELTESNGVQFTNNDKVAGEITLYAFWALGDALVQCGNLQYIGTAGTAECVNGNVLILKEGADGTIFGTSSIDRIEVEAGAEIAVTLHNVNITGNIDTPFKLNTGANATLKLFGTNTLKAETDNAGLNAPDGTTLTITSAPDNGSTDGTLTATGKGGGAGIGGRGSQTGGNITINGGTITATGGTSAPGIGGGSNGAGGTVKITSGNVTATGGDSSAGIGGGYNKPGGTIEISGGTVTAIGGNAGAGIGSGGAGMQSENNIGIIKITDGIVNAIGGAYAAGIGGGSGNRTGGNISIEGGIVTATGGQQGAGIGGGSNGVGGIISISGGTVVATGGSNGADYGAAGIGGGHGGGFEVGNASNGGDITISGGDITATGGSKSAGIGGGANAPAGNIAITGGIISATGGSGATGIGYGTSGSGGTVSIVNGTAIIKGNININPTITNSVLLVSGTVTGKSTNIADAILIGTSTVQINTGVTPKTVTLNANLTVSAGKTFTIPEDVSVILANGRTLDVSGVLTIEDDGKLTVSSGATLNNTGTINGDGSIQNDGTIYNAGTISVNIDAAEAILVTTPTITTASLDAGEYNLTYTQTLAADGNGKMTWTVESGSLPAGLTLNPTTGIISGIPSAAIASATFTVKATNIAGYDTQALSIQIAKIDQSDDFTITGLNSPYIYGAAPFNISTSGGSGGGLVTYSVTEGGDVASVNENQVIILKAGTFKITAIKALDDNYNEATTQSDTITVNKKTVTITGVTAGNKEYDGNATATITGTHAIDGKLLTDDLTIVTTSATATFDTKNVDDGKTVSFTGFDLGGGAVENYTLSAQPVPVIANITQKELTIDNVAVNSKPYDGLNTATFTGTPSLVGLETGDTSTVTLHDGTPTFSSIDVANDIDINFTTAFSIDGDDAGNYLLTQPTGIKANITAGFAPAETTHYTLSAPDGTDSWYKQTDFIITAASGFKISAGNEDASAWTDTLAYTEDTEDENVQFYVRNTGTKAISSVATVSYKKDSAPSTGTVTVGANESTNFKTSSDFTYFIKKDTVTVEIEGTDALSSLDKIYYLKTDTVYNDTEVKTQSWTDGGTLDNGAITFDVDPELWGSNQFNEKFFVYAKLVDTAGNETYLRSDGTVIYTDSIQDTASISFTKTSKTDVDATVNLNGNTIKDIKNTTNSTTLTPEEHYEAAESTITFKAVYLDTLAAGSYTFAVSYNPGGMTFDAGDDATPTTIAVTIIQAAPGTYVVTVTGGTGGGSFAAGDKVSITADAALSGKIFDRWTGGVDFADAGSPATTFIMPANAVTVMANYKDATVVAPPGSQVEEEGDNIKVTLPDGGGTVVVPPGATVMSGENEGKIEVTLPGEDEPVVVPPGSKVMSGENEGEIEVILPDDGGSVIVPPGTTVMSGENEGEIEVTLPGGGTVIVSPGSTVDAEGNVTAPPDNPPATTGSWVYENGVWKYLINGETQTGWLYDTSYKAWFYLVENGTMQTGWLYDQSDKAWYYLAGNGKMVAGKWLHDTDGRWYYLSGNGKMLTGKQTIGGKVYSFKGNGVWIG